MSNDPHIDIDDLDNTPIKPATDESWAKSGIDPDYKFGDVFSGLGRRLRNRRSVLPIETARHLRASQREFLLACRSLIDHSLDHIERQEKASEPYKENL